MEYLIAPILIVSAVLNLFLGALMMLQGYRGVFIFAIVGVAFWDISILSFSVGVIKNLNWASFSHFFALLLAVSFYLFSLKFPKKIEIRISKFFIRSLPMILFFCMAGLIIFTSLIVGPINYEAHSYFIGKYYLLYSFLLGSYLVGGSIILLQQYKDSSVVLEKQQIRFILIGALVSIVTSTITDLVFPYLGIFDYIWVGSFSTIILVVAVSIAIVKYKLFNLKLIATELFIFGVWIAIIVMTTMMDNLNGRILGGFVLAVVVVIGIFVIKGVKRIDKLAEDLGISNEKLEASNRDLGTSNKKLEVANEELGVANENLEITNKKLEVSNRDLDIANEKLKGLDKLKSEFLSLASHQLRSPLTAIKGYTSMLLEGTFGKLEEKQREVNVRILESSQSLIGMIEDFLNVSKIEQGGMQYVFAPTDLSKMVTGLFEEMKISAESKHLEFALEMDAGDTFTVNADAGKLKQVFLNLVDNSIKYTPSGFVHLSLVRDKSNNTITFEVKDSGVGISPETKVKLFQKFSRGEGGKLNTGGSGIGLYLAQEITKVHKGEVVIESEGLGKGSSFRVVLPSYAENKLS